MDLRRFFSVLSRNNVKYIYLWGGKNPIYSFVYIYHSISLILNSSIKRTNSMNRAKYIDRKFQTNRKSDFKWAPIHYDINYVQKFWFTSFAFWYIRLTNGIFPKRSFRFYFVEWKWWKIIFLKTLFQKNRLEC